jgi:hypothetical protein
VLLVIVGFQGGPVWAEDAPPPPLAPFLDRVFPQVREETKDLPAFFRDADVFMNLRTYYFNRHKPDDTDNEALALGGWIGIRSGWLLDTFAVGATFFGSAPLHAPDDRDGTLLLQPGQKGYYVPGEAWGALRYADYARLTGYRQRVEQTYINSQDNRMTPNTFEGVTLGGKVGIVQYLAGFLWNIKQRNSDDFVAMSAVAGVKHQHDGVGLAGVRVTPWKDLKFELSNQYGENMFNTIYGDVDYLRSLTDDWKIRLGAQFTDQRATGDARVATAEERFWDTRVGGARVQLVYRDLTLTTAFSITGSGNTIQSPWGSYPGYLSLIDQDFDRAGEKAFLLGVAYDFNKLASGLSAFSNLAWGWDAINPKTRDDAPNQAEYDLTVDYRPPWLKPTFLRGLWFRARAAILDQEHAKQLGYQFRMTINWERDIF